MGSERVSGFACLVGHDRSWGEWWRHGKPNGVFRERGHGTCGTKVILALGKIGKHSCAPFVKAIAARENVIPFMKS